MARKLTERERFERWAAKVLQTTPQVIHEEISKSEDRAHRAKLSARRAAQKLRKKWCAWLVREVLEELA